MLTHTPYSIAATQDHLKVIADLVPDAVGLRNDPLVSSRYSYPVCINTAYLEMDGGKTLQFKFPESADETTEQRLLGTIQERLELSDESGLAFIRACVALQKLNNLGAWPLRVSEMEPMVANDIEVGSLAYEQGNYLNEAIMYLGDALPSTDSIVVSYRQLLRGPKWRAWVSFRRESEDLELASIDTSAISLHLEATLIRRAAKLREVNAERMRGWAQQLGCEPVQMPKILHLMSMFVANLSLTRIELD